MKRVPIAMLLLAGVLLLPAGEALANGDVDDSDGYSGFGIGARYARVKIRDTDESANMVGAMARARGRLIGFEGAVDYKNEGLGGDAHLRTWPVTASLLVYPLPWVYGLAGLGWHYTTLDFPSEAPFDDETDSQLGYHLGGGIEAPLSRSVSLMADLRYYFIDYEFDEIPSVLGSVDADSWAMNVGVLLYSR